MSEQILDALYHIVDRTTFIRAQTPGADAGADVDVRVVPIDDVWITLPVNCLHLAVEALVEQFDVYHLSTITARHIGEASAPPDVVYPPDVVHPPGIELLYHFWRDHGLTLRFVLPEDAPNVPTVTDLIPGAAFYEREVAEMLGVTFEGHPDLSPLLLPDGWEGGAPLRQDQAETHPAQEDVKSPRGSLLSQPALRPPVNPPESARGAQGATRDDGVYAHADDVYPHEACSKAEPFNVERMTIPIGPQHPVLKEPLSFLLTVEGERVADSTLRIGYVHRGIERLCQERNYVQNIHLLERVCGICSHVHTTTYCQGVEALLGLEVPPRGLYLRTLLSELERVHSHLLWLGVLAENIGFTTVFMYAWRERETVLDIMEELSGGRVTHAVNVIGGVRIDIDEEQYHSILSRLYALEHEVERFLNVIQNERSLRVRTQGVGQLTAEEIRRMCAVGPMARASGVDVDLRRDAPYAAYDRVHLNVVTREEGDVWARTMVRVLETVESLRLCRQLLIGLPDGPTQSRLVSGRPPRRVPEGEVVSRAEAPRGELIYYLRSDGSDRPARVKIRTPSLTSLITLDKQLRGVSTADVAVVLSGADLCIACADR